jgi:hypothetical protein
VQGKQWRRRWVAAVALLRAVGHVLHKVDSKRSRAHKLAIDAAWKRVSRSKPEPAILWGFIESERNGLLNEFRTDAGQGWNVHLGSHAEATYEIASGPFKGRDQRDLLRDAISWWENYLTLIDDSLSSQDLDTVDFLPQIPFEPSGELERAPELRPGEFSEVAFASAHYHLGRIENLIAQGVTDIRAVYPQKTPEQLQRDKRFNEMSWHLRAFFWELFSLHDLMLMWANDHFGLNLGPRQVREDRVLEAAPSRNQSDWPGVRSALLKARLSPWLYEVREYRNASHRTVLESDQALPLSGEGYLLLRPARRGGPPPLLPRDLRGYLQSALELWRETFLQRGEAASATKA